MTAKCISSAIVRQENLSIMTNVAVYLTNNKYYNIYGLFQIGNTTYYLICNDMFREAFKGPIFYNSNLFSKPIGCEPSVWTYNNFRKDYCFLQNPDSDKCFPEFFYLTNFALRLLVNEAEAMRIFFFYKKIIDKENKI